MNSIWRRYTLLATYRLTLYMIHDLSFTATLGANPSSLPRINFSTTNPGNPPNASPTGINPRIKKPHPHYLFQAHELA